MRETVNLEHATPEDVHSANALFHFVDKFEYLVGFFNE